MNDINPVACPNWTGQEPNPRTADRSLVDLVLAACERSEDEWEVADMVARAVREGRGAVQVQL